MRQVLKAMEAKKNAPTPPKKEKFTSKAAPPTVTSTENEKPLGHSGRCGVRRIWEFRVIGALVGAGARGARALGTSFKGDRCFFLGSVKLFQ